MAQVRIYWTLDGGGLCNACAKGLRGSRAAETNLDPDPHGPDAQWRIVGWDKRPSTHEHATELCDHCGNARTEADQVPAARPYADAATHTCDNCGCRSTEPPRSRAGLRVIEPRAWQAGCTAGRCNCHAGRKRTSSEWKFRPVGN